MNKDARFWLLLLAVVAAVTFLVGGAGDTGPPYDPNSVSPNGARGIVEILEDFDVDVAIRRSTPRPGDTAALLLQDRLSATDQFALMDWVRDGGVLVVADGASSFSRPTVAPLGFGFGQTELDKGFCSIDALADAQRLVVPGGLLLDPDGFDSCFRPQGIGALVVEMPEGEGSIVAVGGPGLFTNEFIDEADAAVLAMALLAPQPAEAQVTFLGPSAVALDEAELNQLVAPRITNGIFQLLAAFLLFALFRMRRLGGVVQEPVPVVIQGSELVLKTGVLSERAQDPGSAGEVVRRDFLVRARRTLGVPASASGPDAAPSDHLIDMIAARCGNTSAQVLATFTSPIDSEADLLAMAHELENLETVLTT